MSATTIYAVNKRTKEHRLIGAGPKVSSRELKELGSDWRIVEADADGWIPWSGGECPLPGDYLADLKYRNKGVSFQVKSRSVRWDHILSGGDIIDYRPILDADDEPEYKIGKAEEGVMRRALLRSSKVVGPDVPEWNGKGLPPVGCEVDAKRWERDVWRRAEVIGYHNGMTVAHFENGACPYMEVPAHLIRPIRSDEDRAVEKIVEVIVSHYEYPKGAEQYMGLARALYRAGYRFPEDHES